MRVEKLTIGQVDMEAMANAHPEVSVERVRDAFLNLDGMADQRVLQFLQGRNEEEARSLCSDVATWETMSDYRAAVRVLASFFKK